MQMGIHGFTFILIFIAQTHIGKLTPSPGKGFTISILYGIEAIPFNIFKQADSIVQGLLITCSTMVFT